MMRIAIDTNGCYTTKAGVARYIQGLLGGFREIAPADVDISTLAWEVENLTYKQPQRALKTFYRECVWANFQAPHLLRRMKADLLHTPNLPLISPLPGMKKVVTLHDLAVLRHPERFRSWQRRSAIHRLQCLHRADAIICISQFTADEALSLIHLPAQRLTVIHNGCDFSPSATTHVGNKPAIELPSEFFLFVGSLEPGKNLNLIRQVYDLAEANQQTLPPLLIVGSRWHGVAGEGTPPSNWHYLGHLPDAELIYLYRHALALLFPTKYEGFGFPLVEAMALGCPVICSPVASLREVGGDAACFVESSPAHYLAAMQKIINDSTWRGELVEKGIQQAANFSWKKCASEVLALYRSVLNAA